MAPDMLLHKTELARATLARTGTELGRRERQVLILCDGRRNLNDIVSMLGVESLGMIQALISSGHLAQGAVAAPAPAASAGKGLLGRLGAGTRQASMAGEPPAAPATVVAPMAVPTPVAAPIAGASPEPAAPAIRATPSRRSMAACKMYMIDMLQLQRTPEAASLAVTLQTAGDDDERALALVDALAWLRTVTKASVCERVAERLQEIVPEDYLAGIEAAWRQMNLDGATATDAASNVIRFEARA